MRRVVLQEVEGGSFMFRKAFLVKDDGEVVGEVPTTMASALMEIEEFMNYGR